MTQHARGFDDHLGLLELDAVRAGEAAPEAAAHAAACDRCRSELEALVRLAEGVASLQPALERVPEGVDRKILEDFRRAVPGAKILRFPGARWSAPALGLAAAAAAAFLVVLPRMHTGPALPVALQEAERAEQRGGLQAGERLLAGRAPALVDVNGDGVVDILDAHRLAVLLQGGSAEALRWDANGDGRVDGRDVGALAARVVAL